MDLFVLDQNLEAIAIVDTYNSLIWTDRYQECGDFELYRSISKELLEYIKQDYYLVNNESEHTMIIEKLLINSDPEEGNHITVTGRSLESILERRIIWGLKTISGNLQNGIKTLLEENIISPEDPDRKIDNFVFEESTDPAITELGIDAQYTGDNLYEVIKKICVERGIGFKVTLNDQKQFVFKLYAGVDRSYEQVERPHVVFSPSFDNIVDSNYIESKSSLKNVTLVGGEGEGSERKYATVGSATGMDRRELFTDARDISSDVGDGKVLTDAEYKAQLEQRGKEDLAENKDLTSFEGQAETSTMFVYGRDFFNGDLVQVADEYGHETKARVLEIITSEDEQGRSVYPTFSTVEEGSSDPSTILLLHGETLTDSSVYKNSVTNNGASVSGEVYKFGKSLYFTGASVSYMTSDLPMNLSINDFTVDWWEYRKNDVVINESAAFTFGGTVNHTLLAAYWNSSHPTELGFYYSSNGAADWTAITFDMGTIQYNQWVHRAVVRKSDKIYLFENGNLMSTVSGVTTINMPNNSIAIGAYLPKTTEKNGWFNGYIDEFRILKYARWTENFTPPIRPYT